MVNRTHNSEHGTTKAYVVGYILSLIFTFIPYYMVMNHTISGMALQCVILAIGLLQMIIQLVFFLHLGRGPKPFYNIVFFFATAGIIVVAVGGSLFIMNNLYRNMSPDEMILRLAQKESISRVGEKDTGACSELRENHVVTIKDGKVTPTNFEANQCDTLTFVNESDEDLRIVFGVYPGEEESYGGEFEVLVAMGEPETITLNQTGTHNFYDIQNPVLSGSFTVTEK